MDMGPSRVAFSSLSSLTIRYSPKILLVGSFIALATLVSHGSLANEIARPRLPESAVRFVSENESVFIRSDFQGGRLNDCVEIADDQFDLLIKPEHTPINDSAWYAFQIRSAEPASVQLRLRYEGGTHRYRPLLSHDGNTWHPIGDESVKIHPQGTQAILDVKVDSRPMWICAQELLTDKKIVDWSSSLLQQPFVKQKIIGRSVENRPLTQLEITESDSPGYLVIIRDPASLLVADFVLH